MLHHQIAETLIRLYAAHGPDVECPWLNLSNEYDFGAFKASVEANLVKPRAEQLAGLCREVFLGRWPHPPERLNLTQEQWDAGALNLARFMKHFGKHFLEQAQLYNAAKHGMAVNANRGSFRMSDEEGRSVGHEGPSLSYLERQKVTRKPRVDSYQVVQRWVGVVPTWFICSYGTKMMRNLWFYARSRFLEQVNGFELCLPTDVNPLSIQRELGALMPFEAKLDAVEVESGPRLSSSW